VIHDPLPHALTAGMDPINRRHVWDVIEAAKQDRCVVLTTHSMEEADILGDRIGIMAKGRLRCLGNSVRLKTRFGEGYKVSISCGDGMMPDSQQCLDVKKLFKDRLNASVTEETKAYMQFNLPDVTDEHLAVFFEELERRREELGVSDVQLSMSTLEDVFLKVATESELEEAKKSNKTIAVTLKSGEVAGILLGSQEQLTSEGGTTFTVTWGTDENGQLIPVDVVENPILTQKVLVECPAGVNPGQRVPIMYNGRSFDFTVPEGAIEGQDFEVTVPIGPAAGPEQEVEEVTVRCPTGAEAGHMVEVQIDQTLYEFEVPDGVSAGDDFTVQIPVAQIDGVELQQISVACPAGVSLGEIVEIELEGLLFQFAVPDGANAGESFDVTVAVPRGSHRPTQYELHRRVAKLSTSFTSQADALFRKNLQFQWKRRVTNSFLVLVPALVLALIFGVQQALDSLVLSSASTRCPYCGPATDAFGRSYCMGSSSCVEFFFPNSTWDTLLATTGVDIVAECNAIAGLGPNGTNDTNYCFGNGNLSCYQSQWALSTQSPYCPITGRNNIPVQPSLGFSPLPAVRAKSSVLYTSKQDSRTFAQLLINKTVSTHSDLRGKLLGAMRETTRQSFLLLMGLPELGCSNTPPTIEQQQSLCRLMQHGAGSEADLCCLDLTGNSRAAASSNSIGFWQLGKFTGALKNGTNYWSDMPSLHNDSAYASWVAKCKRTSPVGQCNLEIMTAWLSYPIPTGMYGLRFGSGSGQYFASMELSHAVGQFAQSQSSPLKTRAVSAFNKLIAAGESFTCVAPIYASEAAARLPENQCINLEMGLGILAQASSFSFQLHPINVYESSRVPDCSSSHSCTFTGIIDPVIGTFKADSPGRWPQMCDFFTSSMSTQLRSFQTACSAEANCTQGAGSNSNMSTPCNTSCPVTEASVQQYLSRIPCLCKWVLFVQQLSAGTFFYIRTQTQTSYQKLPKQYSCSNGTDSIQDCSPKKPDVLTDYQPAAVTSSKCWRKTYHALSVPELRLVTPIWPAANFRTESSMSVPTTDWWNVQHVLTLDQYARLQGTVSTNTSSSTGSKTSASGTSTTSTTTTQRDCNELGTCWQVVGKGRGNFSFLADDCSLIQPESCFIQRMANLTGMTVGCISTNPRFVENMAEINNAMYAGQYSSRNPLLAQEYVGGYDFQDSEPAALRVTVLYNDTKQLTSGFGAPTFLRLSEPINAAIDAFINAFNLPEARVTAALLGLKEVCIFISNIFES
jgi:hypothetical protein